MSSKPERRCALWAAMPLFILNEVRQRVAPKYGFAGKDFFIISRSQLDSLLLQVAESYMRNGLPCNPTIAEFVDETGTMWTAAKAFVGRLKEDVLSSYHIWEEEEWDDMEALMLHLESDLGMTLYHHLPPHHSYQEPMLPNRHPMPAKTHEEFARALDSIDHQQFAETVFRFTRMWC